MIELPYCAEYDDDVKPFRYSDGGNGQTNGQNFYINITRRRCYADAQ